MTSRARGRPLTLAPRSGEGRRPCGMEFGTKSSAGIPEPTRREQSGQPYSPDDDGRRRQEATAMGPPARAEDAHGNESVPTVQNVGRARCVPARRAGQGHGRAAGATTEHTSSSANPSSGQRRPRASSFPSWLLTAGHPRPLREACERDSTEAAAVAEASRTIRACCSDACADPVDGYGSTADARAPAGSQGANRRPAWQYYYGSQVPNS
jgi:hypothetical protein